ncbi:hypothetical protein H112_01182 [Trichophyton rubrum D6]|uniref:Uncharacterized protein n=3 Tax=Trichophyton TaxID=5550 RepID=A0A080WQZ2_TRIRC|nr:uncharacterized protein TERG_12566 [Trichophyton rubrum CBS 118892]EZF26631.1 hypothetical protein H100_01175 [Trichophyton rubrum MR850]EZF45737.1 hypothetical protein H102_01172 [Trichophyton rubrum CBS 100081]EZF56311.1 hypothetical protein H103_01179 [Trichophyton rubrum CBS 288.86]EZF67058.1 hypothetical protein H104_01165 [Trichophyton rubrum CBS 289.86]EZF77707.1 hypothetical protein H105_01185 [Trichophyton soudanense CBS 452.61]EZF88239.1 hypothetical protein H110_01182 [Trichophy
MLERKRLPWLFLDVTRQGSFTESLRVRIGARITDSTVILWCHHSDNSVIRCSLAQGGDKNPLEVPWGPHDTAHDLVSISENKVQGNGRRFGADGFCCCRPGESATLG